MLQIHLIRLGVTSKTRSLAIYEHLAHELASQWRFARIRLGKWPLHLLNLYAIIVTGTVGCYLVCALQQALAGKSGSN